MNSFLQKLFYTCLAVTIAFRAESLWAAGVSVGSSTLIETLHYSDTFTFELFSGITGRSDGGFPAGGALSVENNYGNPARAWTNGKWTLNSDASSFPGVPAFPILTGVGSETGMTQSGIFGGNYVDFGIEYGLSNHYVVQFDAVQTDDRIDVTSGPVRDTIFGPADVTGLGLSVFFRGDARSSNAFPNVSLYSVGVGEADTGLGLSGIGAPVGAWSNYAVRFDKDNNEIEIFVNQTSLGVLDLSTFAGGAYAGWSNSAVSVGGFDFGGSSVLWTDNFQVGAAFPVPEPTGCILALNAVACAAATRRRIARMS